jgi:hypothetical protein
MRYTIEEVLSQAIEDHYTSSLDNIGCIAKILYGIRIEQSKSSKVITIHNTTKGGDYYTVVNEEQTKLFLKKGWRFGVFSLALSNYRSKLDIIERKIREEVNSRKNAKHIQSLKTNRQRILNRFAKVSLKLNKIK